MGSAWHTREERGRKEWVLYASGVIALLIIGGIAAAVVVTASKSSTPSSGGSSSESSSGAAVVAATPVAARPPPPAASVVTEQSTSAAKPPSPPPARQAARPPPPPSTSPPSPPTARPPPPAPRPASPPPVARPPPPPPDTYDSSYTAIATTNNVPPAPGFIPVVVNASYQGTCQLRADKNWLCNDGMTGAVDATDVGLLRLHLCGDPTQMEACGFADVSVIANSLVAWAYKSQCGVEAFTIVRACVGIPGGAGDGHWRARVMLWPKAGSPDPTCTPLCLKMRGNHNTLTDYGRHASCNEQTT